jgi:SAM-dependent methyltransferase
VLEVGSGSCVLISQLQKDHPTLRFSGIEPMGPGFPALPETTTALSERFGFRLYSVSYERFREAKQFDLIYSNNVFEHLPDWRDFLRFVERHLTPTGKCIILCPNGGFPYEPHFGVPIVFTKEITFRLFRRTIERFEKNYDAAGLWTSLNFVTWASVSRELRKLHLDVAFDATIVREMIERLDWDTEFRRMHSGIALLAKLAMITGLIRAFEWPVFRRFQPYMRLEISKRPVP